MPTNTHIRWMVRRDMQEVLAIENESFTDRWTEQDFLRCLRQRNCIGMIAEIDEQVVGFMVYELHKDRLHLLNLAVSPSARRIGIGRLLVDRLIGKLSHQRRNRLMLEVRETNIGTQLFLKRLGFRAIGVLKDFYDGSDEDAYLFQYRVTNPALSDVPVNRIAGLESGTR